VTSEDIIRAAAELITDEGWSSSAFRDREGRFCVVGALNAAAGYSPAGVHALREDVPDFRDNVERHEALALTASAAGIACDVTDVGSVFAPGECALYDWNAAASQDAALTVLARACAAARPASVAEQAPTRRNPK
jgi:hypothetical protein